MSKSVLKVFKKLFANKETFFKKQYVFAFEGLRERNKKMRFSLFPEFLSN